LQLLSQITIGPGENDPKLSEMLGVEHERVRLWIFARAAAEPRDDWNNFELLAVARAISP
jgi:hypothetical protein